VDKIFVGYTIGTMGKKRGAPKKPAGKGKTAAKLVRMTDAELATFDAAAELAGLPTSGWMRERLRSAARAELEALKRLDRFVVVAEKRKRVDRLATGFKVPVEVVRFAWRDTRRRLLDLLPTAELRTDDDGSPVLTDEGHHLLDCGL